MKIVHITTYKPNSCGLTEASFNMAKADILNGHDVSVIDTGIAASDLSRQPPSVGEKVQRGSIDIISEHHSVLDKADLIVQHTYCNDSWLSRNQAPIVYILHGRPDACYRQELDEPQYLAFSAYGGISHYPRIKKVVSFWDAYDRYWEIVCDKSKLVTLDFPAIDDEIFSPKGIKFEIPKNKKGDKNIMVCDGNRRDITRFETFVTAYHEAKNTPGLKYHFIGLDTPIRDAENRLLAKIRDVGGLGLVMGKIHHLDHFYRAMDSILTPHSIITQIVGEAIATGIDVISTTGCKFPVSLWTLKEFGAEMNQIYINVIGGINNVN